MTDEGRGRGAVNLEELERQLREASRSRIRAAASEAGQRPPVPSEDTPPDLAALTRPFAVRQAAAPSAEESWPVTPPPLSGGYPPPMPEAAVRPLPHVTATRDTVLSGGYYVGAGDPASAGDRAYGEAHNKTVGTSGDLPTFFAEDTMPSASAGVYGGLVGELPRGFGPEVAERFPALGRDKARSRIGWRGVMTILVIIGGVWALYSYSTGKIQFAGQSDQRQVPVIKPDPTPVKIAPDNKTAEASSAGTELFKKDSADTANAVTKKPSAEQPVDLSTVVKTQGATKSIVPGMGDPKAVKTVTVKPDGTIVGDTQVAPAKSASDGPPAVAQPPKNIPLTEAASAPAKPVAPKVETAPAPVTAQPKGALPPLTGPLADVPLPVARPADLESETGMAATKGADPVGDLVNATASTPEPATTSPSAPVASGDYSVQFGAPFIEADAKGLAKKVATDFADAIEGRDVVVIKADSNGKTVYRVRAVGFTRDEASAACTAITSTGGKCFIARN